MAGKHIVVWPRVRVTVDGKAKIVDQGELVPSGVSDVDLDNLVSFGAIAGVRVAPEPDQDDDSDAGPTTIKAILAEVGEDKDKAAAALEAERAGENRPSLIKKLETVLTAGN